MELINQRTKKIMEGCKTRAWDAGLRFEEQSLEYILTNKDLLELTPKAMIPTLYDYWVHDVEVLREKGKYELYPSNPYETVINTRPAISFYNDNNPDWLNVMIFYHVLGHIDFFQNNIYFRHTWDFDFTGQALSDKRIIAKLRSEKGRWVDYIIEFARGIDNLTGYFKLLYNEGQPRQALTKLDFYFDTFIQSSENFKPGIYIKEIDRYNQCVKQFGDDAETQFFLEVKSKHPEFDAKYDRSASDEEPHNIDLMEYIIHHSPFLQNRENEWMKTIIEIVRNTALFFQPQIRTKIMNEGWASYWHEKLFLEDPRINGHEVEFAKIHASVTSLPKVGLNPYALGLRLFQHIESEAEKGRYHWDFDKLSNMNQRKDFDRRTKKGLRYIFDIRKNLCDFTFINQFVTQDFTDAFKLYVADKRLNQERMVWEYYIKSRRSEDYQNMLKNSLYHPPHINISHDIKSPKKLHLSHTFEGKPLVSDFIKNTLIGIEFLWGAPVSLETTEIAPQSQPPNAYTAMSDPQAQSPGEVKWRKVKYTMNNRRLTKEIV